MESQGQRCKARRLRNSEKRGLPSTSRRFQGRTSHSPPQEGSREEPQVTMAGVLKGPGSLSQEERRKSKERWNNLPRETGCSRTAHSLLPALEAQGTHVPPHPSFRPFLAPKSSLARPSIVPQGPRTQPGIHPAPGPLGSGCPNARAPFSLTGCQSPLLQPAQLHPAITALHSAQPPLAPVLPAL